MRVLFICTKNAIRSPMAEALGKAWAQETPSDLTFASAGIEAAEIDGFAWAVMTEIGLDLGQHNPQNVEDLDAQAPDLVITLSEAAHRSYVKAFDAIEHWDIPDPSLSVGNREQRLEAYRYVRNLLQAKINERFAT